MLTNKFYLYGHHNEIVCMAMNTVLEIIITADKNGICIIH